MKFETVCFAFEIPIVKSYYSRYDFALFEKRGMKVVLLDLSLLFHPGQYEESDSEQLIEDCDSLKYIQFSEKKELREFVKNNPEAFYWMTFQLTPEYMWCIRCMSRHRYGFICNVDYYPLSFNRMKTSVYYNKFSLAKINAFMLTRIPHRLYGLRDADAVITYSEELIKQESLITSYGKNTILDFTNTIDYMECIKRLGADFTENKEDYLVFLDQYLPYHPDGLEAGYRLEPLKYYEEINSFLHRVSSITGLKVIVAAHPKADYEHEHPECFSDFSVIKFKSAELVKNAKLVVSHFSLSVNYCIFFEKPLLLVTTDGMNVNKGQKESNDIMAKSINRSFINISEPIDEDTLKAMIAFELEAAKTKYSMVANRVHLPNNHPNKDRKFGEVMLGVMDRL